MLYCIVAHQVFSEILDKYKMLKWYWMWDHVSHPVHDSVYIGLQYFSRPKFNLISIDLLPAADSGFWSHHVINYYYLGPAIGLQLSLDLVRRLFNISNINQLSHYQNICVFAHILLDEEDVFNMSHFSYSCKTKRKNGISRLISATA